MTEFLSRRERREAEKSGQLPTQGASVSAAPSLPIKVELPEAKPEAAPHLGESATLTRRELRERERAGQPSSIRDSAELRTTPAESVSPAPGLQAAVPEEPSVTSSSSPVLPAVSLSAQVNVVEQTAFADPVYMAEPSTNSIVLDRIPDAVGIPLEVAGEVIATGSIAILTEPVDTVLTGPLDDRALDSISANDAVTGAITIVEPVSALEVIKNRPSQSVLPVRSLKSGWWKPVLLAVATLVMIAAAIVAALVIINTLGL